jgi:hypothetical protein
MDHTRAAQLSTGFRRLSLTLGIIAGLSVLVLLVFKTSPSQFCEEQVGRYSHLALVIIPGVSGITTWALVRLIGWTILGFYWTAGPNGNKVTIHAHGEEPPRS